MKRLVAVLAFAAFAAAARADDGAAVFAKKCAVCHGKDGKGAPAGKALGAKDLTTVKLSEAEIVKVVENGKGKMTGFKGKLSDDEVKSVAKYVKGGLK
ncbi:cytochrome c class I [Anaeromyxobacter dehalogenans 2CP-1]|uniref:Cytochrome c class I n=1 Tax=Anaeromyxobacter dehalogenans (strain ATCC BAA-258 / DSM 21875 / 2CP-1) TaxID=455488 RepID=B8JCC0_ANAD2|nr:cytochrome c [Anaeromyxobacter dehalogenans]ACL65860.1 cytochrome c class I [Anaeromyxobacter dehalogenans 2CP-1]